jgi:hypothetical protein
MWNHMQLTILQYFCQDRDYFSWEFVKIQDSRPKPNVQNHDSTGLDLLSVYRTADVQKLPMGPIIHACLVNSGDGWEHIPVSQGPIKQDLFDFIFTI